MLNAAILEKFEELPEHIQDDIADYIELLHQKYVEDPQEEEELERTPDGDVIIGYDMQGNPKLASVMKEKYKADLEAVRRGEFITFEDFEKESETWLKSIK